MTRRLKSRALLSGVALAAALGFTATAPAAAAQPVASPVFTSPRAPSQVTFASIKVDGLNIELARFVRTGSGVWLSGFSPRTSRPVFVGQG